jgi:error-prone DNA polymerase
VISLALEGETGTANVVVWKKVYETFHKVVITGRLVGVTGRIERDGPITHVIAELAEDVLHLLATLGCFAIIDGNEGHTDEVKRPVPAVCLPGYFTEQS